MTLLVLVTVTTGIIAGTIGYSQAAATTAARAALTTGAATEAGVQVQTRLAEDPGHQDDRAREEITALFAPAPVTIARTVVSEPRPVSAATTEDAAPPDGTAVSGRIVIHGSTALMPTDPEFDAHVEIVEGTWPLDGPPIQAALHAATAQSWGVGAGDLLTVDDQQVELTALWQPVDPQAPFWFADELVRTGEVDGTHGPLIVDEAQISAFGGTPFVRWTIRPDAATIQPEDLAALADAADNVRDNLREDGVAVRGITIEGDLAPTAATAARNLATARALGLIPLSVLILVTGLAVVQLARLLAATREPQVELLVARGASRAQVMSTGMAESAIVALLGAVLGTAGAWGVLQFVPGGQGQASLVLTVAALTFVGVLAALVGVSVMQARRLVGAQTSADRSGRARAATALATVVLVLGAAGLSWWQLRRAGSPLVTHADGSQGTDLIAGAAPALLLAAAAVIALALLGPLTRLVEVITHPTRAAGAHLASSQVSRHLSVYAVPVVLTVLAVGATTLASLYAGTSAQLRDDLADVAEGAPLRADLVRPLGTGMRGQVPEPPFDAASLSQVEAASLVWLDSNARVGDIGIPLTMADTHALAQVVHPAAAALVPQGMGGTLAPGAPGSTGTDAPEATDAGSTTSGPTEPTEPTTGEATGTRALPIPVGTEHLEVQLEVGLEISDWGLAHIAALSDEQQALIDALREAGQDPTAFLPYMPEGEDAEKLAVLMPLHEAMAAAESERTYSVSLLLREVDSGMSHLVPGEELTISGLSLDISDPDQLRSTPTQDTGTITFTLPADTAYALEAVTVHPPALDQQTLDFAGMSGITLQRYVHLDLQLAMLADGQELDLSAAPGTLWGSPSAMDPAQGEPYLRAAELVGEPEFNVHIDVHDNGFDMGTNTTATYLPLILDTSGSTWQIQGPISSMWSMNEEPAILIAPGESFSGSVPPPELPGDEDSEGADDQAGGGATDSPGLPGIPGEPDGSEESGPTDTRARLAVALTTQAATAANLQVGDDFELTTSGMRLPARLTELIPAVPGSLEPQGALADSRAAAAIAALDQGSLNYPNQIWATPSQDDPEGISSAVEALQAQDALRAVTGPGGAQVTDATSAARLVFWVASAGAVLLSLTGIAAVAATLVRARRPEVAVLRALGMPPGDQARSRALELAGVVAAAIAFGLLAGWAVGTAVVPELARSTTLDGQVSLPAALHLEVGPWAVLLGVGAAAIIGLLVVLGSRIRQQGLDRTYREEIR